MANAIWLNEIEVNYNLIYNKQFNSHFKGLYIHLNLEVSTFWEDTLKEKKGKKIYYQRCIAYKLGEAICPAIDLVIETELMKDN